VAKLEWARAGQSRRHLLEDGANILQSRWDEFDRGYVEHWVTQLGLQAQWEQARKMAGV
jgi:hypothetical protein